MWVPALGLAYLLQNSNGYGLSNPLSGNLVCDRQVPEFASFALLEKWRDSRQVVYLAWQQNWSGCTRLLSSLDWISSGEQNICSRVWRVFPYLRNQGRGPCDFMGVLLGPSGRTFLKVA